MASIASGVQRAGGSAAHPGTALDEALEQKVAYIEGGASPETSSIGEHAILAGMPHYITSVCVISHTVAGACAAGRSKMWDWILWCRIRQPSVSEHSLLRVQGSSA